MWIPGGLQPGQPEGVGHLVFREVFRALHVLNLFNLTGKASTWLQRSLCPIPHAGGQVWSGTCLAQKCPSGPREVHFWGGDCTNVWSNDWCRMRLGTRDWEGAWERYIKDHCIGLKKKKRLAQALEWESSMDTRQQELTQQPTNPFSLSCSQSTV